MTFPPPLPFDPWATPIEVEVAMDLSMEQHMQYAVACSVAEQRDTLMAGGSLRVMEAISRCMVYSLPVPEWLASFVVEGVQAVSRARVGSWDAAFGKPFPKGTRIATLRKAANAAPVVLLYIRKLLDNDPKLATDESLFDDVVKHFGNQRGLGRSEVQRIYYEEVKRLADSLPRRKRKTPVLRRR